MEPKDLLKRVSDALGQKANEKNAEKSQLENERRQLVTSIGNDIAESLRPYMERMVEKSQVTKEDLKQALSEVQINVPESTVHIPEIKVPQAQINVNVPEIKLPTFNVPPANIQYPDMMRVGIDGVDHKRPLPVMMMGPDGKPFSFSVGLGGGGKSDFFTVKGITNTIGIVSINPDGSPAGAGSVASSVSVSDIFSTVGANVVNPDGRIKVELPTGSSSLTDTELRASHLDVQQLSGAIDSVFVTGSSGTLATNMVDSTGVAYSGSNPVPITWVSGAGVSTQVNISDSSGVGYSGSNPLPVTGSVTVSGSITSTGAYLLNGDGTYRDSMPITGTITGITNTIAVLNIDSGGVGYSGSNPLPVTLISGALTSTIAVGSVVADAIDDGSAPVQSGGIARQTNPTAVSDNDVVKSTHDDLGRQITRMQVRDLVQTAYATSSTGIETTLLTATAGTFSDCIMLTATNASTSAVQVDIRNTSGGNIVHTFYIPATTGPVGWTPPVPWPMDATGNSWTFDVAGSDVSGTSVYVSGLFTKEV